MSDEHNHWLVIFYDDAAMLERRSMNGKEHLDYLSQNSDKIKMAGGLRNFVDTPFKGGAWVVNATDKDEVEAIILNDPYYCAKHRKYDISFWGIAHNSM